MVTLKAENIDTLIKQAKAEKRKALKQSKIETENRNMANILAYANLGHIVDRAFSDGLRCNFWTKRISYRNEGNYFQYAVCAEQGTAQISFYRYEPIEMLLNGAGYVLAIKQRDTETNRTEWLCIGVYNELYSLIPIPQNVQNRINQILEEKQAKKQ